MLTKEQLLQHADIAVQRLILQYKEYTLLESYVRAADVELFQRLAVLARETSQDPGRLQAPEAEQKKQLLLALRQRISDEMTFANPTVWMMYKHKAYRGTSQELATLDDFRRHCAPADYICGKRFRFFTSRFPTAFDAFDANISLADVYQHDAVTQASLDPAFMAEWQNHEYHIAGNRIAKWAL